ncbi:MAG: hypothetical protein HY648_02945 [Acidobacteria bacterium]|nr:hypothetical protein [Acidobacteriota bacterium]
MKKKDLQGGCGGTGLRSTTKQELWFHLGENRLLVLLGITVPDIRVTALSLDATL